MTDTFEEYLIMVKQRNKENFSDGHIIEFKYPEDVLEENIDFFKRCHKNGLSPYKALTFLEFE
jgi:hypothetical protein